MARVSVSTTAIRLDTAWGGGSPRAVLVKNKGTASVFIERTSAVTTATGFELEVGAAAAVDGIDSAGLYGIAASGTHVVHVLQVG